MNGISVVVPAHNEEENIPILIQRIGRTLKNKNYEIIVVDDHSTDSTGNEVRKLSKSFPVYLLKKDGEQGKATSLIQGFRRVKFDKIVMIDADLQYPPEAIRLMVQKIDDGSADIVVAQRKQNRTSFTRRFAHNSFQWFFCKVLHNFDLDVQSGLKAFRTDIIKRFTLDPSPWTFDLEFVIKARDAGYRIDKIGIRFDERKHGTSKMRLFAASYEIGLSAIRLKFRNHEIIPFSPSMQKKEGIGFHFKGNKFVNNTNLAYDKIALFRLNADEAKAISGIIIFSVLGLAINWHATLVFYIALLTLFYFADLIFNFVLISLSFTKTPEVIVTKEELEKIPSGVWPTYTIFCPLYKEWSVIPQFINAISRIDYPKNKIQVLLLLEEDDKETLEQISNYPLPNNFETIVVPNSLPKTKPKALNHGLNFARGNYSVVYDAEDVPDSDQLKKAVLAFSKVSPDVLCLQAKLNFYNPNQNVLTKIFTSEYSLWFDLVLTGLHSMNAPIPLGGTSNHFRTSDLRSLGGWDAFNVTEDCDLGVRIAKQGNRTEILDSMTLEEANSNVKNWFSQRTRWIKGYMQTYLVHMRKPGDFKDSKKDLAIFQLIVGGKILSMLINPLMWIITISYFLFRVELGSFIQSFYPAPILYLGAFSLVFGNFMYLYYYMIGSAKRGNFDLIKYSFLVPIYWLAISAACAVAIENIIVRPHYWAKTMHGFHFSKRKAFTESVTNLRERFVYTNSAEKNYAT